MTYARIVFALCAGFGFGCGQEVAPLHQDARREHAIDEPLHNTASEPPLPRQIMASCPNGGNVTPTVPAFAKPIDDYGAYDGQTTCASTSQPGVVAFRDLLLATYPCTGSYGILIDCSEGGQSEHKEGRAFDWKLDYPHPAATALLDWLLKTDEYGNPHAMARRFGIMYMIWNSKIWKSYQSDKGWQAYSGSSPHTDHVHFSFTWAAARKQTSYFTAGLGTPPSTTPEDAGTQADAWTYQDYPDGWMVPREDGSTGSRPLGGGPYADSGASTLGSAQPGYASGVNRNERNMVGGCSVGPPAEHPATGRATPVAWLLLVLLGARRRARKPIAE